MSQNNNRITRDMQIAMGLIDKPKKGHRTRADLGLPVEPEQTAIVPRQQREVIYSYDEPVLPAQPSHKAPTGQTLKTSHKDRTDAYIKRMVPVSLLGAFGGAFAYVTFSSAPILSTAFFMTVLLCGFVCLMIGEIGYQLFSPDGIGIFSEYLRHRRLSKQLDYIYNHPRERKQ